MTRAGTPAICGVQRAARAVQLRWDMKTHRLSPLLSLTLVAAAVACGVGCTTTVDGRSAEGGSNGSASNGGASNAGETTNAGGSGATRLDGSYAGSYAGDATGPVTMTVTRDKVDVVVKVDGRSYAGSGDLDGASIDFGVGTGNGVVVTFQGRFADGAGSGTWRSSVGTKGSWSVAR